MTKWRETTRCDMCEKTIPEGKAIVSKISFPNRMGEKEEARFDFCGKKCYDRRMALLGLPSLEEQRKEEE